MHRNTSKKSDDILLDDAETGNSLSPEKSFLSKVSEIDITLDPPVTMRSKTTSSSWKENTLKLIGVAVVLILVYFLLFR